MAIVWAIELRCRGVLDAFDLTLGELWAHKRVLLSLDARDAARAAQASALGSRAAPAALRKHMGELGVSTNG